MKKALALILALLMALSLAACGSKPTDVLGCEGKYIAASMTMMGVTLTGDEAGGIELTLDPGGKGKMFANGETGRLKWKLEGDVMTITVSGQDIVGTYSTDRIDFRDFLVKGVDYVFAIEGSDVAEAILAGEEADLLLSDLENLLDGSEEDEPELRVPEISLGGSGTGSSGTGSCEGKYFSAAMTTLGVTVTGEDTGGFELVLDAGGTGTFSANGSIGDIEWTRNGDTLTIVIEGRELVGTYSTDRIDFKDFLGLDGVDYVFAIEGSAVGDAILAGEGADVLLSDLEKFSTSATLHSFGDLGDADTVRLNAVKCMKDGEEYTCDSDYVEFDLDMVATGNEGEGTVRFENAVLPMTFVWSTSDAVTFTDKEGDVFEGTYSASTGILSGTYFGYDWEYAVN